MELSVVILALALAGGSASKHSARGEASPGVSMARVELTTLSFAAPASAVATTRLCAATDSVSLSCIVPFTDLFLARSRQPWESEEERFAPEPSWRLRAVVLHSWTSSAPPVYSWPPTPLFFERDPGMPRPEDVVPPTGRPLWWDHDAPPLSFVWDTEPDRPATPEPDLEEWAPWSPEPPCERLHCGGCIESHEWIALRDDAAAVESGTATVGSGTRMVLECTFSSFGHFSSSR